ncbi:DUF4179 domain-containing protein [Clostridium perfringens]|uniref:DUF4179 domain-containing protein n=1 Tax=Clostridium perfringens TaxID=1502 RepID=UPI0010386BBC|nr:DUF4179 domain-containing protein [Clostridium perfringens]TBX13226.1 hypothetical protein BFS03_08250 [Clostridium perfringens]
MKNNDDLFDKDIRNRLKMENMKVPEEINKKIDDTINNLGKRKRNYKKASGICAACIAGTIIFGVTMPTYAQNIPILGKIFERFDSRIYENYDKYASDLNITKESNGYRVTINKIVYDTLDLEVFYTIQSDKPLEDGLDLLDIKLGINNNFISSGFGGRGEKVDDFTYVGVKDYSIVSEKFAQGELKKNILGEDIKIPNNFDLNINISSLGNITEDVKIEGDWNFNIPISDELVRENIKEQNLNINLGDELKGVELNKLIQTPINTVLKVTETRDLHDYSTLSFVIFDDKGRYLYSKSGTGIGDASKNENSKLFTSYNFKEVYDDSKSLTIIPYIQKEDMNKKGDSNEVTFPKEFKEKLNLNGETEIRLDNGEIYSKIKKIESVEEGTRLYYESKYSIYGAPSYIINNETGEKIEPIGNKEGGYTDNIKYVSGNEFYIDFKEELVGNNYTVVFSDRSNYEPYGESIKIDLK